MDSKALQSYRHAHFDSLSIELNQKSLLYYFLHAHKLFSKLRLNINHNTFPLKFYLNNLQSQLHF